MEIFDLKNITQPIFYVTPDLNRAIGLEKILPNYHIVCIDETSVIDHLLAKNIKVLSLERELGRKNIVFRNTGKLLGHPFVKKYIKENARGETPHILFFKPSPLIDKICDQEGYQKLGNSSRLNWLFEDKVSFARLIKRLRLDTPRGEVGRLFRLSYKNLVDKYGLRFVVQFGRGWAGNTTFVIEKKADFERLKTTFARRLVKISEFIRGTTILNNACVTSTGILVSPPASQITAPSGFTSRPLGTCGRQWPAVGLSKTAKRQILEITKAVGEAMKKQGYRGFFGLDFLVEEETHRVFILENNARLTASVPIYTKMELVDKHFPLLGFHILEFLKRTITPQSLEKKGAKKQSSELVLRNSQSFPVEITQSVKSGVYRREAQGFEFKREGYSLEDIRDAGEFLLLVVEKGRVVNPEIELARLNTWEKVLDEAGQLKSWTVAVMKKIYQNLGLRRERVN